MRKGTSCADSYIKINFHIEGDFEDTEEGEYCLDGAETAENGKSDIILFH